MAPDTTDRATLLAAALDAAALSLCILDAVGVVRYATQAWHAQAPGAEAYRPDSGFNYLKSLENLAAHGTTYARLLHDGIASVLAARTPRFRLEHPARERDRRHVLEASALPGGGAVVTHLDVTAAYVADVRYRRLAKRYGAVTTLGRIGVWEVDPARRRLTLDSGLCELLGYPDSSARDWTEWRVRVHPDDVATVDAIWGRCAPGGERQRDTIGPFEVRLADTRGGYRSFDCVGNIVRDANRDPITAHGTLQDVTDRRAAQDAVERSNRHLQELARRLAALEETETRGR